MRQSQMVDKVLSDDHATAFHEKYKATSTFLYLTSILISYTYTSHFLS
jgi:hypothetical protein